MLQAKQSACMSMLGQLSSQAARLSNPKGKFRMSMLSPISINLTTDVFF